MTRDYKRGRGSWHGCHMFKNIICDGEFGHGVTPRDGALKMRGRYWYHVRFVEFIFSNMWLIEI